MSKKSHSDQPADDWAGLAQNLFGINLDKGNGDDDLLDDDMFKVELPKPPEPAVVILQSEVEFAPLAESVAVASVAVAPPAAVAKPPVKLPPTRAVKPVLMDDEPFGFGVVEEAPVSCDAGLMVSSNDIVAEDAGLTLPEDFDTEGLTLPADYDDGLTLAPEASIVLDSETASDEFDEDESDEEDSEEGDTKVIPVAHSEAGVDGKSDSRRRRQPRRTREDAYWDMLENWEWEEIPDSDAPRGEGDRPRTQRGDRGGGGRSDRGRRDRGRDERPRSESRPSSAEVRTPAENRPPREERRPAETPTSAGGDSAERPRRPQSGDRPRDDRGPRSDRPRGERRPERDDRCRDESPQAGPKNPSIVSLAPKTGGGDDFGSGIFDEQPKVTTSPTNEVIERSPPRPREESIAQTSRAADAILRSDRGATNRPIEDELVWPDDESDVRPAPIGSVMETSGLPPAEAAGESDETVSASDVRPLDDDEESRRPRRRRRRRREPRSGEEQSSSPSGDSEGTTFDLSDALAADSDSPDFIPSASADDSGLPEESSGDDSTDENRSSEDRGVRRRRRRRRRPGEGGPSSESDSDSDPDHQPSADGETADDSEASGEENYVVKPITYSNIPSWEDAIRYLLQPQLVGRNLGPDDTDDSLENDPRGSGGAEPTPPPPSSRRRSGGGGGGGGRGRRP